MAGVGKFVFEAGMLKDGNGATLTTMPDVTPYYSNAYLGAPP